jgi:hypothetical protein
MSSTHRGDANAPAWRDMMNTHDRTKTRPVDLHAALARAHADRAEYIGLALGKLPALIKRAARKLRPNRLPRKGAWA